MALNKMSLKYESEKDPSEQEEIEPIPDEHQEMEMPKLIRDSLPENPEEQIENEPETPFVPEWNIFMREWRVFVSTDFGVMQLYRFTEHIEVDIKTKRTPK